MQFPSKPFTVPAFVLLSVDAPPMCSLLAPALSLPPPTFPPAGKRSTAGYKKRAGEVSLSVLAQSVSLSAPTPHTRTRTHHPV